MDSDRQIEIGLGQHLHASPRSAIRWQGRDKRERGCCMCMCIKGCMHLCECFCVYVCVEREKRLVLVLELCQFGADGPLLPLELLLLHNALLQLLCCGKGGWRSHNDKKIDR